MEDTTLQVVDIRALPVTEGEEHVTIAAISGIPQMTPDGRVGILPLKTLRIPLTKQGATELINSLTEEVDKLPEPKRDSGLVIPGSPAEIDQVAQNLNRFK